MGPNPGNTILLISRAKTAPHVFYVVMDKSTTFSETFGLVDGFHRMEACKALSEETVTGFIVEARRH